MVQAPAANHFDLPGSVIAETDLNVLDMALVPVVVDFGLAGRAVQNSEADAVHDASVG